MMDTMDTHVQYLNSKEKWFLVTFILAFVDLILGAIHWYIWHRSRQRQKRVVGKYSGRRRTRMVSLEEGDIMAQYRSRKMSTHFVLCGQNRETSARVANMYL